MSREQSDGTGRTNRRSLLRTIGGASALSAVGSGLMGSVAAQGPPGNGGGGGEGGACDGCPDGTTLMAKFEWEDGEFKFEEGYDSVSSDLSISGTDFGFTVTESNDDGEPLAVEWDATVSGTAYFANSLLVKAGTECSQVDIDREGTRFDEDSSGTLDVEEDTDLRVGGGNVPAISSIIFCKNVYYEVDFANSDTIKETEAVYGQDLYEFVVGSNTMVERYGHLANSRTRPTCLVEDLDGDGTEQEAGERIEPNASFTECSFTYERNGDCQKVDVNGNFKDKPDAFLLASYEAPGPTVPVGQDSSSGGANTGQELVDGEVSTASGRVTITVDLPVLP